MDTNIIYRPAIVSDVLKLSVLYKTVYIQAYGVDGVSDEYANFITKQFSPERLAATIRNEPGNIIVAEYKGNLVGVAEIEFAKKCPIGDMVVAELNKLYVLERFCSKGIGGELLKECERFVRSKGEQHMWLWAWDQNPRAISFYERLGYHVIGEAAFPMEQNTYINIVMTKQLLADNPL